MQAEQRAGAVLAALGLCPATRSASGRYQRSLPISPGVRYWSSSQPRSRRDLFGVQFFGEGLGDAGRCAAVLQSRGFVQRSPQTGQMTFAKAIDFAPNGELNEQALLRARKEVDAALGELSDKPPPDRSGRTFREFMLNSPWADVEIELPERKGGERDISFLSED